MLHGVQPSFTTHNTTHFPHTHTQHTRTPTHPKQTQVRVPLGLQWLRCWRPPQLSPTGEMTLWLCLKHGNVYGLWIARYKRGVDRYKERGGIKGGSTHNNKWLHHPQLHMSCTTLPSTPIIHPPLSPPPSPHPPPSLHPPTTTSSQGLVCRARGDADSLDAYKLAYCHDTSPGPCPSLAAAVHALKPSILIGMSNGKPPFRFDKAICQAMAAAHHRPLIMPLSKPSVFCPADAYEWTEGRALFANGEGQAGTVTLPGVGSGVC